MQILITSYMSTGNIAIKVDGKLITISLEESRPNVVKVLKKDMKYIQSFVVEDLKDDEYIINF